MRLAETQALTGQHEEAKTTYAAFMEVFPESRWARNARFGLAFATENGGDSANAIPEYKKLLDDPKVDLWTVRSRFQTGECQASGGSVPSSSSERASAAFSPSVSRKPSPSSAVALAGLPA